MEETPQGRVFLTVFVPAAQLVVIGAVSPAEIAVAIMAQVTERLRQEPDEVPDAERVLVKAVS